ncbi:MAG: 2-dehydro-3-deoxyphosphooctonate aldolase, partial [Pseudomonadota bacterium]
MVHGACASIGCYAMTDAGIEEIYAAVETTLRSGQTAVSVHVFPFRLTDDALADTSGHEWINFWRNLKQGYDIFEQTKRVPNVSVDGLAYVFD